MGKGRLEAFSDGVIAVIITIMVLELKVPHGTDFAALGPLVPVFLSYVISFVYVGIYWNNHHHLMHAVQHVNGRVLWANLHLLFWLSLIPFVTGWVNENHFAALPVALYGVVLLMAGVAYYILERALICASRQGFTAGARDGTGFQGHRVGGDLRRRHRAGVGQPMDFRRSLRVRGDHVVHPGSPDRARGPGRVACPPPDLAVDGIRRERKAAKPAHGVAARRRR